MPTPLSSVTSPARYDEAFYDVPNQRPAVPLALRVVSVRNQQVLLRVADELIGGTLPLLCDVDVRVSLRGDQRGIHMSRIQTALQPPESLPLSDLAAAIAARVQDTQRQDAAEVRLTAQVPLAMRTRVSGLPSPDTVEISALASAGDTPQFVEDVVRSVASGFVHSLDTAPPGLVVDVEAESHESIHGHDVHARLTAPAADLAT